jgi:hypothetical protein
MKDNGKRANLLVEELKFGQMAESMKVNGEEENQ